VVAPLLVAAAVGAAAFLPAVPEPCWAVSGGGLDYANLDITGQDFSNGNYKGKDFTQGTFQRRGADRLVGSPRPREAGAP
jgi:hypothetical protein